MKVVEIAISANETDCQVIVISSDIVNGDSCPITLLCYYSCSQLKVNYSKKHASLP